MMMDFDENLFEDDTILPFEMEGREKVFVEDATGRILVVRNPTVDEWHYFSLREQAKLDAEEAEAFYLRTYYGYDVYEGQQVGGGNDASHGRVRGHGHGGKPKPRLSISAREPSHAPSVTHRRSSHSPAHIPGHHDDYGYDPAHEAYDPYAHDSYGNDYQRVTPPDHRHGVFHEDHEGNLPPPPPRRVSTSTSPRCPPKYESDGSSAGGGSHAASQKKHPGVKGHHPKGVIEEPVRRQSHVQPQRRRYQFDA